MLSPPFVSFRAHYESLVSSGAIEADAAQQQAAQALGDLEQRLGSYKPLRKQGLLGRLFADPATLGEEALAAGAHEFIRVYRSPAARMAFLASLRHIVTERPEPFFASLRRIKQPTLVIFGERDRVVPARFGVRLAQHLPNAKFMVLPNVGHVPQFEATRETLDALTEFMAGAPAGKPRL